MSGGGDSGPSQSEVDAQIAQQQQQFDLALQGQQQQAQMALSQMQMQAGNSPAQPFIPPPPDVIKAPDIDFTDKIKNLAAKVKSDESNAANRKRGRSSTILTSPLLDEEETSTTKTLLT